MCSCVSSLQPMQNGRLDRRPQRWHSPDVMKSIPPDFYLGGMRGEWPRHNITVRVVMQVNLPPVLKLVILLEFRGKMFNSFCVLSK